MAYPPPAACGGRFAQTHHDAQRTKTDTFCHIGSPEFPKCLLGSHNLTSIVADAHRAHTVPGQILNALAEEVSSAAAAWCVCVCVRACVCVRVCVCVCVWCMLHAMCVPRHCRRVSFWGAEVQLGVGGCGHSWKKMNQRGS